MNPSHNFARYTCALRRQSYVWGEKSPGECRKLFKFMTNFDQKIWDFTQKIPRGKVVTYAGLARMAGNPKASRAVGNALNKNLYRGIRLSIKVPCHRVVRSDGSVGGFARGTEAKINLLKKEGVKIRNNKVSLKYIINRI